MKKYDFFGQIVGKLARRRLEQEVRQAQPGPVLSAVVPLLAEHFAGDPNGLISAVLSAVTPQKG